MKTFFFLVKKTTSPIFQGKAKGIFALLLIFLISGCAGYRFASDYNNMPGDIKSISIPFFKNETFESNIETYFTEALVNEFIKNKQFTITPKGADAVLEGVVKEFRTHTIAHSHQDRVLEYRAYVTLDLTLTSSQTGEIIWRKLNWIHDDEYKINTNNIALTEAKKRIAIRQIAAELAEQIYEDLVLGF